MKTYGVTDYTNKLGTPKVLRTDGRTHGWAFRQGVAGKIRAWGFVFYH